MEANTTRPTRPRVRSWFPSYFQHSALHESRNMPPSSRHGRTTTSSPPLSTYSTTTGNQHKLNVVTRLAIEGKATRGTEGKTDGASIKMFLKVSICYAFDRLTAKDHQACHTSGKRYPRRDDSSISRYVTFSGWKLEYWK